MILYDYKSGLTQQESIDRLTTLLQDLQFLSGSPNFDVPGGHWMTRHEWADLWKSPRKTKLLLCVRWCRIVTTDPADIPVILTNWATVTRASSSTIARTAATLSSVVTSPGRPIRGASSNDLLSRRSSANHSKTEDLEGAWSPKAACNRSMLSCCVNPLL